MSGERVGGNERSFTTSLSRVLVFKRKVLLTVSFLVKISRVLVISNVQVSKAKGSKLYMRAYCKLEVSHLGFGLNVVRSKSRTMVALFQLSNSV